MSRFPVLALLAACVSPQGTAPAPADASVGGAVAPHNTEVSPEIIPPPLRTQHDDDIIDVAQGFVRGAGADGGWWRCGRSLPRAEWWDYAMTLATEIVRQSRVYGQDRSELSAVIWHESRGDPCALGPHPRRWAREAGLLPAARGLSHTRDDVLALVSSRRWQVSERVADLGLGQIVWPSYPTLPCDGYRVCRYDRRHGCLVRVPTAGEMLSLAPGVEIVARELRARETLRGCRYRPSACWPGRYDYDYQRRIGRWCARLGWVY